MARNSEGKLRLLFLYCFLEGTCTIYPPLGGTHVTFKVVRGHIALFADCCALRDLGISHLVEVVGLWEKVALGAGEKGKALSLVKRKPHLENA